MLSRKSNITENDREETKVTKDVREEKQSYRECERGKAKLQGMIERKSSYRGRWRGNAKLQRMIWRKSKVTEDVRWENQSD